MTKIFSQLHNVFFFYNSDSVQYLHTETGLDQIVFHYRQSVAMLHSRKVTDGSLNSKDSTQNGDPKPIPLLPPDLIPLLSAKRMVERREGSVIKAKHC